MRALSTMALAMIALTLAGCISETDPNAFFSTVRVAPMGPGQFMVTCVDSPLYCARMSNKTCPAGYDVVSNTSNSADYGRMTMIIKCH
jgi:hypothetical protein